MKTLPKEFTELNITVKDFNNNLSTLALFGEQRYLLLQGNRTIGYKLLLMDGKPGEGRVHQILIPGGANKKQIIDSFQLLNTMALGAMTRANTRTQQLRDENAKFKMENEKQVA